MFVAQTLEDPLRRVSLLHRPSFVLCQDPLNHPDERIQLRARRRPVPPVARRHGKRQHLRHRAGVNAKAARRLPATDPLNPYRVADPRIKLHQLHPPAPCTQCKELPADAILLRRNRTAGRFSEGFCLRRVHLATLRATFFHLLGIIRSFASVMPRTQNYRQARTGRPTTTDASLRLVSWSCSRPKPATHG